MLSNDRSRKKKKRGGGGWRKDEEKPPVWKAPPTVNNNETQGASPIKTSLHVILALGRQNQEDQKFKLRLSR